MKKPLVVSLIIGLLMILAAIVTIAITPSAEITDQQNQVNLESLISRDFDGWKIDESAVPLVVNPDVKGEINKLYSQTLSRTYINNQGERVMLSIAYGRNQRTELQIHRPEICYLSNGFEIGKLTKTSVATAIGRIPVMQLVAKQGTRNEPITYWIRVGDFITRDWFEQKAATFRYMMSGKVPDGLLFRVSTISNDVQDSYRIQKNFMNALLQTVSKKNRCWLIGRLVH